MTSDWTTGIYLVPDQVLNHPDYVTRLRDEIGLNTVVLLFNGEMPEDVLALSPFKGRVPTDDELAEVVLRHFDGRPIDPLEYDRARELCGPGAPLEGDDGRFTKAVNQLKQKD